jgi:hypothetical protein
MPHAEHHFMSRPRPLPTQRASDVPRPQYSYFHLAPPELCIPLFIFFEPILPRRNLAAAGRIRHWYIIGKSSMERSMHFFNT